MFLEYPLVPVLFKSVKKKGSTSKSTVVAEAEKDRNGWAE